MAYAIQGAVAFMIAVIWISCFLDRQNPRQVWGFSWLMITIGFLVIQNIINTYNVQALIKHNRELRQQILQIQQEAAESTAPSEDPLLEQ